MSQNFEQNFNLSAASYAHFSDKTQLHVDNMIKAFESFKDESEARISSLNGMHTTRLAAVLVLLFERDDHLRVLLTTRAEKLRSHGGETCFPGGKMEEGDKDIITTALREANEEIGLPMNSPHIHVLGTLPFSPFHSMLVAPVVALLTDNTLLDNLDAGEDEVKQIFSYPFEAALDPDLAAGYDNLVNDGTADWPYKEKYHHHIDYDVEALGDVIYRVHHYQTVATPITAMTSDVLMNAAELAYRRKPNFERYAPSQLRTYEDIVQAYTAKIVPHGQPGNYRAVYQRRARCSGICDGVIMPGMPM